MTPDQYILLLSLILLVMMVKEYIGVKFSAEEIKRAQQEAYKLTEQANKLLWDAVKLIDEAKKIVEESGSSGADRAAGTDDRLGP